MGPGQVGALGRCPSCPGSGPGLMATLAREKFRNFVIRDSIAMLLSMSAIAIYFIASFPIKDMKTVGTSLFFGNMLILFATLTMVVAFLDGLQAVLYPSLSLDWITGFIIVACVPIFLKLTPSPRWMLSRLKVKSYTSFVKSYYIIYFLLFLEFFFLAL